MKNLLLCLISFMLILSACTDALQGTQPPQEMPTAPITSVDELSADSAYEQEIEPEPELKPEPTSVNEVTAEEEGIDTTPNSSFAHDEDENIITSEISEVDVEEANVDLAESTDITQDPTLDAGGSFERRRFRPIFYDLPAPFVDLIGTEIYLEWLQLRSPEERYNENIAVSFIRDFDISKEDFILANETLAQIWESIGVSANENSSFELYPVDLIFSFDNNAINEFFLWENSPAEEERHLWGRAN